MGNIVWLASYPKSGNTWLRAFLANLIANRSEPVPLNDLLRYAEDEANPDLFTALAGRPSADLDIGEIAALRPRVHAAIAERAQGTRFVKTHNMTGSFDGHPLHNMQVTAGAIYVVRNPLDVAISMTHHFGISLDEAIDRLADANVATLNDAQFVSQIIGSWSMHVKGWADMAGERVLVLRYEDLLDKPGKQFAKVARLVGLGQDRARIERAMKHAGFQTLASLEKKHGFIEASDKGARFFRKGRINEWREVLSRDQVARVVSAHREQMARFGYVPAEY
ncbi:sulfotransferase domain-containing protein [Dokdonella soli]|uniref:Sulfotransferase domain-containing protein n=1 Tax=Dokdonella soli TaxID=529810 RepID=A0ABN1IBM9_9GAMM